MEIIHLTRMMNGVDNLINNLVDQGTIKYYSGGDMAEYRKYLEPLLKPYLANYEKTHMDAYRPFGNCHWLNPTFGLTLANIVMPNETWSVRSSSYHTTIVNDNNTKIFDILYFDENDKTLGGPTICFQI